MIEGLAAHRTTGALIGRAHNLALLAEGHLRGDQVNAGLGAVAEALAVVQATHERWWEPELHRLNGELRLARSARSQDAAEADFRRALELARTQQQRALALRAATSLARLWQRQGKGKAARALLGDVLRTLTEGLDTADVRAATAVLNGRAKGGA